MSERPLEAVVEEALVAFSQDPAYFVSMVDQGRVNAARYDLVTSSNTSPQTSSS